MADQSNLTTNDVPTDNYMLSRTFSANTRQTLQHYLWKEDTGYLLHPSIPTNAENLEIAEIGVGTGIWLLETARMLPPSARLDGLDVSFAQCPRGWLPPNISFHLVDCTAEPPSHLLEKYDIIHVQLFITIIRDGDPVPVLRNLIKMLKPGGYISWGEWDYTTWEVVRLPSASSQTNSELDTLLEYTSTLGKTKTGPSFINSGWVSRLHKTFAENNLENVVVDRKPFSKEIAAYILDTFMVATEEISYNVLDKLGGGQGDVARALIAEVAKNKGTTAFRLDCITTVAQKPRA